MKQEIVNDADSFSLVPFSHAQLQVEVRSAMGERDAANARALADLDARVSAINARLNHVNASMDGKVQNVSDSAVFLVFLCG